MDGIINFNKPVGVSSAKALYRVRTITGERKSGHAGTLDPGASGVLVLCMGRATKLVERVMDQPKVYRTTARLDVTSESFDSDRPLVDVGVADIPTYDEVAAACATFEGITQQVPPAISALKVRGRPAYKRKNSEEPFNLSPRPVRIDWCHLHAYDWPTIDFEICCGRGTYVRALIRDLGRRLGTGGCLTSLVRRRVGPFADDAAWSFDTLDTARDSADYLTGFERAVELLAPHRVVIPPRPTERIPATIEGST